MRSFVLFCLLILSALPLFAGEDHDSTDILLEPASGVSINTINARYNTTTDEVLTLGTATVYKVSVHNPANLHSTVAAMQKDPDIQQVEFNFFGQTPEAVRRTISVIDGSPSVSKYYDQTAFLRMNGPEAQSLSTGLGVVVAVVDTGVDYNHPQLAGHMLRDSSNNIIGYNFVDNTSDPMDVMNGISNLGAGHGTHVSGIIALVAPDAKIMPLRALNADGVGTEDYVANAINYAVEYAGENNVRMVINLSLTLPQQSFLIQEAIQEALNDGIPVIASAGNDNNSLPHYPAAGDSSAGDVIGVAATDANDVKASFSDYGRGWVDIAAPGVGIYSTFLNAGFAWWDGTSMAAPFASGEAALVLSVLSSGNGENIPVSQVVGPMLGGVDNIYGINGAYKRGNQLGSGRLDLYSAVMIAEGADQLTVIKALYATGSRTLTLKMRSSKAPAAILRVDGIGQMTYDAVHNVYTLSQTVSSAPPEIVVRSSAGGFMSVYVGTK